MNTKLMRLEEDTHTKLRIYIAKKKIKTLSQGVEDLLKKNGANK